MAVRETSRASIALQLLKCLLAFPVLPFMLVESQIVKAVKAFKQVHAYFGDTIVISPAQCMHIFGVYRVVISACFNEHKAVGSDSTACGFHRVCNRSCIMCLV